MAQSNVNMSKLKRSFQMLAAKIPQRTICEQLHMGRGVLNRYKTLAGCRLRNLCGGSLYPIPEVWTSSPGYRPAVCRMDTEGFI